MKRELVVFVVVVLLTSLISWFSSREQNKTLTTPLPSYLDSSKTLGVSTLNVWLPDISNLVNSFIEKPQITARAALVYDLTTDKVIYSKNPKQQLPIASLTKIMTAIIALENAKISDVYTVGEQAVNIGENSMGLTAGEQLTVEDLLYGLLLVSGNDGAEMLAQHFNTAGNTGRETFIKAMNDKAKALGLKDTFFINPSGLEEDGTEEFSTAQDLLVITKYALAIAKFVEIVSTYEYIIPYNNYHKAFYLYNDTNLLTTYPGVKGVKPGYTPNAGLCLVTYAENGGHKLIGIVLGSESRREEMRELLDYSFKTLGIKVPGRN